MLKAANRRVRKELVKLGIAVNAEKSRLVDLERGETFIFLGFDFRRVRSLRGAWRPQYTPTRHKRVELLHKLREVFRYHQPQPVQRVIREINPILAGSVACFRVGMGTRGWDDATAAKIGPKGVGLGSRHTLIFLFCSFTRRNSTTGHTLEMIRHAETGWR